MKNSLKKRILEFESNLNETTKLSSFLEYPTDEKPISYHNKSDKFLIPSKSKFSKDFFYEKFLKQKSEFYLFFRNYNLKVCEILEIPKNMTIAIVGIIEMDQTYSKNAAKSNNLINLVGAHKFLTIEENNEEDGSEEKMVASKIFIKDNSGRIELIYDKNNINWITTQSNIKTQKFKKSLLINGAIIGVIGETKDYQNFIADTIVFLGIQYNLLKKSKRNFISEKPNNKNRNSLDFYFLEKKLINDSCFVLFISNLEFHHDTPLKYINLLKEFLINGIFSTKIKRIIIIGSIFAQFENLQISLQSTTKTKLLYDKSYKEVEQVFSYFENFFLSILQKKEIFIDLMPGTNDSQSPFMPQYPLENLNFLQGSNFSSYINCVSNPYLFDFQGVNILGTSGQNIRELKCYSDYLNEESIDMLENLCYWGNICPKNIGGREFDENFDLIKNDNDFPQIIFSGNCNSFQSKTINEENSKAICKLIAIPSFFEKHSSILINMENLDCFEINFS